MERVMGIEPTQPAWKAGILAIELHPRFATVIILSKIRCNVNILFAENRRFIKGQIDHANPLKSFFRFWKHKSGKCVIVPQFHAGFSGNCRLNRNAQL